MDILKKEIMRARLMIYTVRSFVEWEIKKCLCHHNSIEAVCSPCFAESSLKINQSFHVLMNKIEILHD